MFERGVSLVSKLIVLGNQAGDLDSMASSVAYAALCSLSLFGSSGVSAAQVLPIMPIPRADFHLRREAVYVFQQAGISVDDLVFWDEVDLATCMARANIVLVDHNELRADLVDLVDVGGEVWADSGSRVSGGVDQHVDKGKYLDAKPRIIEPVGSTATLVTQEFLRQGEAIPQEIVILLAGTLLLDTVNLDAQAGRVTAADREAAAYLLPRCPLPREEYYANIRAEKFNMQGFTSEELLRKDYKERLLGTTRRGIA